MRKLHAIFLVLVLLCCGGAATVPASDWKFIGDKRVSGATDHDIIFPRKNSGALRKIKLRVTNGSLKIKDLKLYFSTGGIQDVSVQQLIPQGGESFTIDMNGGIQIISKIAVWYETRGVQKTNARLAVWGK